MEEEKDMPFGTEVIEMEKIIEASVPKPELRQKQADSDVKVTDAYGNKQWLPYDEYLNRKKEWELVQTDMIKKHDMQPLFSHKSDEWSTPQALFDELNKEFHFTLDVCANFQNKKCDNFFDERRNGLIQSWGKAVCFMNPPYSKIADWMEKAYAESQSGATVVAIAPSRTDTRWFHKFCYRNPDCEIRFIKGRLRFGNSKNSAPFPSMILVFKKKKKGWLSWS